MEIYQHRHSLSRSLAKLRQGKLTVGFIGGSITDGRPRWNWPEPVIAWFVEKFPAARIVVENAAIGATGSDLAVFRAKRDLIDRGADLVFVEYAVNDAESQPQRNRRTQEGLLRQLLSAGSDVVLVYTYRQEMYKHMIAGNAPPTVAAFEELADHYGLGSVWMGLHAMREVLQGRMRWDEWLPDGLHPQFRGGLSYAQSVTTFLEKELLGAPATDSAAGVAKAIPAALDPLNWENAYSLDYSQVRTEGPWSLRRSVSLVWHDVLLQTAAPGAKMEFDFDGRVLLLGFDFNKASAEFIWRLDGGEPVTTSRDRPDWIGPGGWYRPYIVGDELPPGRHHFQAEVIHGDRPDCAGTDFRLTMIGVVP